MIARVIVASSKAIFFIPFLFSSFIVFFIFRRRRYQSNKFKVFTITYCPRLVFNQRDKAAPSLWFMHAKQDD